MGPAGPRAAADGHAIDKPGPAAALQMVAVLGAILAVIFGLLFFYFKARGGYRGVQMGTSPVPAKDV